MIFRNVCLFVFLIFISQQNKSLCIKYNSFDNSKNIIHQSNYKYPIYKGNLKKQSECIQPVLQILPNLSSYILLGGIIEQQSCVYIGQTFVLHNEYVLYGIGLQLFYPPNGFMELELYEGYGKTNISIGSVNFSSTTPQYISDVLFHNVRFSIPY